jgi:hypothetical protein
MFFSVGPLPSYLLVFAEGKEVDGGGEGGLFKLNKKMLLSKERKTTGKRRVS